MSFLSKKRGSQTDAAVADAAVYDTITWAGADLRGSLLNRSISAKAGLFANRRRRRSTDVEGEISVRPGEETIYELHANEPPDGTFGTYRSIYHWVLAMAEETKS